MAFIGQKLMLCCNVKLEPGTQRISETKNIVAAGEMPGRARDVP
jgi:hypothetical protein